MSDRGSIINDQPDTSAVDPYSLLQLAMAPDSSVGVGDVAFTAR